MRELEELSALQLCQFDEPWQRDQLAAAGGQAAGGDDGGGDGGGGGGGGWTSWSRTVSFQRVKA